MTAYAVVNSKTCSCERAKIKPQYIQISAKSIVGQKTAKPLHVLYKPVHANSAILSPPRAIVAMGGTTGQLIIAVFGVTMGHASYLQPLLLTIYRIGVDRIFNFQVLTRTYMQGTCTILQPQTFPREFYCSELS